MKYHIGIVSLGCSKNLVDTEVMLGLLHQHGFAITNEESLADVLIINTCGFIETAKQESINNILELAQYKETGKCKLLVVTGCLAERYQNQILEEIPEVDAVVGTGNYHEIADVIDKTFEGSQMLKVGNADYTPVEGLPRIQSTPSYTAYLKIADGCDNHCTYCIIPKLRGRYRSRKMEDILTEARKMADNGVREFIIIAQDTSKYGEDLYGSIALPTLLIKLSEIEKIKWIRIHYCYPESITNELIDTIKVQPKICNYLDIPIQHCNDEILKRMGRRGRQKELYALIERLRKSVRDISIRTSIIVGFPGETGEAFDELEQFVKQVRFDRMGVFTYSREEDTPAAQYDNQIDEQVKKDRYERLMETQANISLKINQDKIGSTLEVLIEGYDAHTKRYYGRTYADSIDIDGKIFIHSAKQLAPGTFINVTVTSAQQYDLIGEIQNESCK